MSGLYLSRGLYPVDLVRPTIEFLLREQLPSGAIPWFKDGYADPWDHVEAAMALSIGGELAAAERAYHWLRDIQLEDGSWWAAYRNGEIDNKERRETIFGVEHTLQCAGKQRSIHEVPHQKTMILSY